MASPIHPPPAPSPAPLPLPPAAPAPPREPTDISYTAYSPSPSSIEAHRDRRRRINEWTAEVPTKHSPRRLHELGAEGPGSGSTITFGKNVGVGSAVWSDASGSDTGTVPTTIRLEKREKVGMAKGIERVPSIQVNHPVQSPAPPTPNRPQSGQPADKAASSTRSHAPEAVAASSQTRPPALGSAKSRVRSPPIPALALPPSAPNSNKPSPAPSPRLPAPGDLLYPLPAAASTHSQREAYLASALDLPLELLSQVEPSSQPVPPHNPPSSTSSQLTTSRLGSLLGRKKDDERIASEGTGSTTSLRRGANAGDTLRSRQNHAREGTTRLGIVQHPNSLTRSKTDGAMLIASRGGHSQATNSGQRPPQSSGTRPVQPDGQTARSNNTVIQADARALPSSSPTTPRGPTLVGQRSNATFTQAVNHPLPSSTVLPPRTSASQATVKPSKVSLDPDPFDAPPLSSAGQAPPSDATYILAARQLLPPSTLSTNGKPPSAAIYVQAAQKPLPPSVASSETIRAPLRPTTSNVSKNVSVPAKDDPVPLQLTRTWPGSKNGSHLAPPLPHQPHHIPLPPSVLTAAMTNSVASDAALAQAPTHRQQRALPRPAISRSASSFDGIARALGRKHRDPSSTNLQTRFEPAMYPLPPSATASSPVTPGPPRVPMPASSSFPEPGLLADRLVQSPEEMQPELPQPVLADLAALPLLHPQHAESVRAVRPTALSRQAGTGLSNPMQSIKQAPSHSSHINDVPEQPATSVATRAAQPRAPTLPQNQGRHPHAAVDARGQNIYFTPSSGMVELVREDEDHVSFEVPSGSRGRLRVSLAWLRDGPRSPRRQRTQASEIGSPRPPPVPPKSPSQTSKRQPHPLSRPIAPHEVKSPVTLSPTLLDPPKREGAKSPPVLVEPGRSPTQSQAQAQGWYNPHYSGATLPPYRPGAQMQQVYQMQFANANPWAYPQPGSMPVTPTFNPWGGLPQVRPPGVPSMPPPTVPPPSPGVESIDPPSSRGTPPAHPHPLPPTGYPQPMLGLQAPFTNGYGDLGRRYYSQPKPTFWARFRGEARQEEVRDNHTIRAWRKNVSLGRAPTVVEPMMTNGAPTNAPGRIDLLAPPNQLPSALRRKESTVWDRLMWRRRTEEGYYARPRRTSPRNPVPSAAPARTRTFPTTLGFGFGRNEARSRYNGAPDVGGSYQSARQRREQVIAEKEKEKEERRRARRERRDERQARAIVSGQGSRSRSQERSNQTQQPQRRRAPVIPTSLTRPFTQGDKARAGPRRDAQGQGGRGRGQETVRQWIGKVSKTTPPKAPQQRQPNGNASPRRYDSTKTRNGWREGWGSRQNGETKLKRERTGGRGRPGAAGIRSDGRADGMRAREKRDKGLLERILGRQA